MHEVSTLVEIDLEYMIFRLTSGDRETQWGQGRGCKCIIVGFPQINFWGMEFFQMAFAWSGRGFGQWIFKIPEENTILGVGKLKLNFSLGVDHILNPSKFFFDNNTFHLHFIFFQLSIFLWVSIQKQHYVYSQISYRQPPLLFFRKFSTQDILISHPIY